MRRAFTLLELLVAVLLGGMIVLIIAGSLRTTIQAWEAVQERVSENYNRRGVLDIIKRQTSSLFFKSDAQAISNIANTPLIGRRPNQNPNRPANAQQQAVPSFNLPPDTHYFKGSIQELSFLSTVSFLSDFPGQVAVRYYVVQGGDGDADSLDGVSTRTEADTFEDLAADPDFEDTVVEAEELEGNLYLYLEEKNLFLSMVLRADADAFEEQGDDRFRDPDEEGDRDVGDPEAETAEDTGADADLSEVTAVNQSKILGPLRKFSIQYRRPGTRGAQDEDGEDDWETSWDVGSGNTYPSAIEFILFYEHPGVTDDIPTEELPGIRMVIPIYDTRNLARGGPNVPF